MRYTEDNMDLKINEEIIKPDMETVILFAANREDALKSVSSLCNDIKSRDDANHRLYFNARLMGMFVIAPGEVIDDKKEFTGNRELIIFPAMRDDDFERLKASKNLVSIHNANWVIGDGPRKVNARKKMIDWLLNLRDDVDGPLKDVENP